MYTTIFYLKDIFCALQGVTMCVSEAVFGVYFKLTAMKHDNSTLLSALTDTPEHQTDLTWLAVGSMGLFIAG